MKNRKYPLGIQTFENIIKGHTDLPHRVLQEKHLDMLDLDDIIATADRFDTPTENITDPVPVLYQSGYLTIKGYNRKSKIFKLGFPNSEVKQGFSNSLFRYYAPDNMGDKDAEE